MGEKTLSDLSALVIDVLLPFYMFYTTSQNASLEALGQAPIVLLAGIFVPFISALVAPILYKPLRVPENRQSVFSFCIMYANTAFLGIPVCESLFGPTGAFYAVIYDFGLTIVGFSLGIWLLSGGKTNNWKNLLLNPLLISVIAGLIVALFGIEFPLWLSKPFSAVGQATLPVALLVAGAQIGNISFQKSSISRDLIGIAGLRLAIIPLLMLAIFSLGGSIDIPEGVIILEAAMPLAVSSTIMVTRYQGDAQFAATGTLITTVLSMLTLPLMTGLILLLQ